MQLALRVHQNIAAGATTNICADYSCGLGTDVLQVYEVNYNVGSY